MSTVPKLRSIDYACNGPVATIAINRPDARNSLTVETTSEVYAAVRHVATQADVRVVVFRGVGRDFCCGADLHGFGKDSSGDEPRRAELDFYHAATLLHEMRAVTIAAIRGGCAGAGFGWACACDFRVADESMRINTAFLDVGVAGDMGIPWFLPRLVGSGRARDLSFFPRKLLAAEALDIGLLSRVWSTATFEAELDQLVARLAGSPPLALATLKSNYVEAERMGLSSYILLESERHNRLFQTEDRAEAFAAYVEKRAGKFRGR